MKTTDVYQYRKFITNLPAPGGGGAHSAIFGAECFGARAGLTPELVCADIRNFLPTGTRVVADSEIEAGVRAGFAEVAGGGGAQRLRPRSRVATGARERLILQGRGITEADIRALSPVRDSNDLFQRLLYLSPHIRPVGAL